MVANLFSFIGSFYRRQGMEEICSVVVGGIVSLLLLDKESKTLYVKYGNKIISRMGENILDLIKNDICSYEMLLSLEVDSYVNGLEV